jgi:hypothetical protein
MAEKVMFDPPPQEITAFGDPENGLSSILAPTKVIETVLFVAITGPSVLIQTELSWSETVACEMDI